MPRTNSRNGNREKGDLTPKQRKELEERLFQLGKEKYGFDPQTARRLAKRFAAA